MKKLIYSFEGNDLRHYAGVAKQYDFLDERSRHFLYNIGSLLYLKENGESINLSNKQENWTDSLLTQLTSEFSIVDSCCLSKSKAHCSRCEKLKNISAL